MAKQILGKVAYVSKGDYNNELFYEINDVVTYNGSSYVALGNTLGNLPTNTSYWQLLAQKGDAYTVSEEDLNTIKQEIVDDANNDFNQNVNSKTEEFDTHVETKTSEFDTHVQEKTNEFDTNAAEYDERITQNTEDITYNFARTNKNFQDSLEYKEAWGSDITFEDSTEFPLGKLDMDGKSEQDLNKMIYKCNGTEIGDYYFTYEDTNYQFTMPSITGSSILVFDTSTLKLSINDEEITTSNNNTGTLIELLETPNPDYPQEINSIEGDLEYVGYGSKNLLNATVKEYTNDGLTVSADNNNMYINGVPTRNNRFHTKAFKIPKGTYTLSLELVSGNITSTSSQKSALFYLYKDYSFNAINKNSIQLNDSKKQNYFTFTLEEDTNVNLSIFARTIETFTNAVIQYQITKGESADYDFAPYKGHTLTIPTNGQVFRKVGDVADKLVIDMKTGDYYKEGNIDYYNFTGDENYILSGSATDDILSFAIPSNLPFEINDNNFICNRFIRGPIKVGCANAYNPNSNGIYTSFRFNLDRTKYPNLEDGINYLKENNTYINFLKVTPTLEKLGTLTKEQLDTLVTFKGYNNVMINTNLGQADIDIEYVLDMKKYYNNTLYNNILNGNNIVFNNGLEFPLEKLNIDGKSEQVTTTGSQLFDVSDNKFSPSSSITYDDEGWITVNYTNTSDSEKYVNVYTNISEKLKPSTQYNVILEVKNFTNAQGIGVITVNQQNKGQFATSYTISSSEMVKGKKYSKICTTLDNFEGCVTMLRTFLTFTPSGVMSNTITFRISVIEDISVTTENFVYELYTGGQPSPNPDYPQEINSIEGDLEYIGYGSKNFIGVEDLEEKTENGLKVSAKDQVITLNGKSTLESGYPPLCTLLFNIPKKTDKYTFKINILSGNKNGLLGIRGISSTGGQLWNIQMIGANNSAARELTDEEIARTVKINLYTSSLWTFENLKFTIQLTKGTSATDYVPYVEPRTLTIPTNGQVFRKVRDVADKLIIDMKTGDYYKQSNIGEKIFNGSENWTLQSINEYGIANFGCQHNLNAKYGIINCNYFIHTNTAIANTKDSGILWQNFYVYIRVEQEKASTVEEFKQWLNEHNTIVDYQLNNPTLEKIGRLSSTDLNKLRTFKGYNDISINTNMGQADIEVEYVLDIKKYIDEKVAEISEQLI